ncbi:MAG TPA: lysophospholipid acyltransferase family protein [Methylomirabilota bacterium]|nr:lysophospholipid acyltransferase family protein [Methylomirabilota bacterium]
MLGAVGLALFAPVGMLLAWLPTRLGLWVGRRLGDLAWVALSARRALTLENLRRAFGGEQDPAELRRLGRRSFEHLGMNLVESCVFFFRPPDVLLSRVTLEGVEHLKAAATPGRGILLLTAHFGNWELLAAAHALSGFALSVVVRPLDNPVLDRVVARLRRRAGVELITKRQAVREVLDALRRQRMVGVLLDQNAARSEGVFVPFFGVPASTSKALAVVALRAGAPVAPVFIRRDASGHHTVHIEPALPPPADRNATAYTAAFTRAIEAAIRRAPEQWFWMHARWRTRPRADAAA